MQIEQFFLEGLGHQSYFVTDAKSGQALVVDPRRDVEVYMRAAKRADASITHILETHIHNDYVTGARELAAQTGATIVGSAEGHIAYEHKAVRDEERFTVGTLPLQVMATPGHTPEHVSYVVYEEASKQPYAVFSGGSMLVGGVGRTDLLGPALTMSLTRQQYHSLLHMLETLPGNVLVYPTHGAGSFCVASTVSTTRATTIAQERLVSPAIQARTEDEFIRRQLAGYTAYPHYYAYMHDINQAGPRILGSLPQPSPFTPSLVRQRMQAGMPLVDARSRQDFARAHIPGSINVELEASFATYVGWILPFNTPLMLLIEDENGRRESVVQLVRISYEQAQGYLEGGISAWEAAALPLESYERISVDTLYKRWSQHTNMSIVDVRRDDEWQEGHIPDSLHVHLGDLPQNLERVPRDVPVAVICRSGYRAAIGASIIAASGREVIAVEDGVPDWTAQGLPTTVGAGEEGVYHYSGAEHAHP